MSTHEEQPESVVPRSAATTSEPSTPFAYRDARPETPFRLLRGAVTVTLVADDQARYRFECELETLGNTPAEFWFQQLPANASEISSPSGLDDRGSLQVRVVPGNFGTAVLEVRLGQPVRRGERYKFSFGYETAIRSIVSVRALSRVVAYSDWLIFNVPCDLLTIDVCLPRRARLIRAVPAADAATGVVRYAIPGLQSGQWMQYLVGYQRMQVGAPFWAWIASAIGSGLIGALIGHYVEAILRR
jgi:hypothetical protein